MTSQTLLRQRLLPGSSWIFRQRETDVFTTTWHFSGERVTVLGLREPGGLGYVNCTFPDGIDRWAWRDELHPLPSSNPALRALPQRLLRAPRDVDYVSAAMFALLDVLVAMDAGRAAVASGLPADMVAALALTARPVADIAADWLDDACGAAQGVLDGDITASDVARGVRALHLWLTVAA